MQIFLLTSESHEDPSTYDKRFEKTSFLGAFTSVELAQSAALTIAASEREHANEELEDGESPHPEVELNWTDEAKTWSSDTLELIEAFHFEIRATELDPA